MKRGLAFRLAAVACGALAILLAMPAAGAAPAQRGHQQLPLTNIHPVVFVHGFAGSGAQFESQKMRFTENGYPDNFVQVFEYDSTFSTEPMAAVQSNLGSFITQVEHETGTTQVDLVGHSLGTFVDQTYLDSSPANAANVAHYVNIDGQTASSPPGGVPTLALWAGKGTPGRTITGAINFTVPDVTHVQCATSPVSFSQMFQFFTGQAPRTTDILRQGGRITISGRAMLFPQNIGVPAGAALSIWRVNGKTGRRISSHPAATPPLASDGSWGPVSIVSGKHYEFALAEDGQVHHYYYEPFLRSDHLIRLLTQVPGTGLDALWSKSPNHVDMLVTRYQELWGNQGSENDVLSIDGTNVINAATAPISHLINSMFAFDQGNDKVSNVSAPIPAFFAQPFISAVDLYIPASTPPKGTVSVSLISRGAGPVRTVNFPNFPSTTDVVTVQFNDFNQLHE
jgi:AF_1763-like, C-terminal domain/Lipase C-terminal domain/Lipase (class 2)